ncbi:MAG: hypothetical protein K9J13_13035 [Saprospiraceae bacterium]|nr:hypothetical protein [Saprospiraceae bacterium]
MNFKVNIIIIVFAAFFLNSCKTTEETTDIVVDKDKILINSSKQMLISLKMGEHFNHPTFVIWEEDMNGNYKKTIFITQSIASGQFRYQMINDTLWLPDSGKSYQPAALPYWSQKKGLIDNVEMTPTPEHQFVDAYSGATPKNNFQFKTTANSNSENYRILLEVNQSWDWNKYWTNNKYPDCPAYNHSAQPSIIYAVTINQKDMEYFLNPIGHGDAKGESGKLFTDLSSLTTAKEIFSSIKIEIIKN